MGVCHGVIQSVAPGAVVIDVAHGLPPRDVRAGALVLRNTLPFVPQGVHLAVVDPGVGTKRRPVALRCGSRLLVGPDNGLLWLAAEASGGVEQAVDLSDSPHRLEPVSATFHGRDLFAPVTARLALGDRLEEVGEPFAAAQLARLELPVPTVETGAITGHVVYLDHFGNVQVNLNRRHMEAAGFALGGSIELEAASRHTCIYGRTFGDVPEGELVVYEDSYGMIAIALNGGHAGATLGVSVDQPVRLTR